MITMVREIPSLNSNKGVFKKLPRGEPGLQEFFKNPSSFYEETPKNKIGHSFTSFYFLNIILKATKKGGRNKWLGHNSNFWDLGYTNEINDDLNISSTVNEITKKFDLIMISDFMDQERTFDYSAQKNLNSSSVTYIM